MRNFSEAKHLVHCLKSRGFGVEESLPLEDMGFGSEVAEKLMLAPECHTLTTLAKAVSCVPARITGLNQRQIRKVAYTLDRHGYSVFP